MPKFNLLAVNGDAKTAKSNKADAGYLTAIMYLAPADIVEGVNLCPAAKLAGCREACLFTAGRGIMSNVQAGRVRKTVLFRDDRPEFLRQLVADLEKLVRYCAKHDVSPAVRLNGTSDIAWEAITVERNGQVFGSIMEAFPEVQFYDYTKLWTRRVGHLPNYHLTFSYSEASARYARKAADALANGMNVAVVFRTKDTIPAEFLGRPVIDGDETDMRFLDPEGVIVGLYAKGSAKKDTTGFVIG